MASLSSPYKSFTFSSASSSSSFPFPKPSQLCLHSAKRSHRHFKVSCTAADGGESQPKLDRRDVILGLGGLYGAASLITTPLAAVADPIQAPEVSKCVVPPADLPPNALVDNCCPPVASNVVDYKVPFTSPAAMRVRPAAHRMDRAYAAKFEKAIALMKALPADDPRNFYQQANVHCAYCNGGYVQVGFPDKEIQVHNSWLFFPFHRWYLYFYERILGKLIGDPTFALPFWNWDTQEGMVIPSVFTANPNSSLYNENRNQSHLPPTVVDLGYDGKDTPATDEDRISNNLFLVYKNMVSNAGTAEMFLGKPYRAGDAPNSNKEGMGPGNIESVPHTPIHRWVGDVKPRTQNGEDLGNFYSAGRDVLFYCHHANVDRMWTIWQQLGGAGKGRRRGRDFPDSDWLDSTFIFYDENAQAVRVRVGDALDNQKLGYKYEFTKLPWLDSKPKPVPATKRGLAARSTAPFVTSVFPVTLDKVVQVKVARPRKSRSKEEKEAEEEILLIEGIEVAMDEYAKFDVYLNDEDEPGAGKLKAEYAGSFASLPHKRKGSMKIRASLSLGLNEPLEDLGAEDDDAVLVTLAPKVGGGVVTVDNIKIVYGS
ncbi:polyphenol oxidase II, chloroplastic-like [Ipomoea triloba]|uniref:polyphenol oxidase II, chloroplastic-like n=1 Tax=Ipomoea triloba TaxID=35885 RepID=UPI00125D0384|nr:polyphenol oxidase II, chloroplastic-like [Ipomoea triloba]